jgi:hypothetical protein
MYEIIQYLQLESWVDSLSLLLLIDAGDDGE